MALALQMCSREEKESVRERERERPLQIQTDQATSGHMLV
jgi:hypothetical protein